MRRREIETLGGEKERGEGEENKRKKEKKKGKTHSKFPARKKTNPFLSLSPYSRPRLGLRRDPQGARALQPRLPLEAARRSFEQSRPLLLLSRRKCQNRPRGLSADPGARGADQEGRRGCVRGGGAPTKGERQRGRGRRGGRRGRRRRATGSGGGDFDDVDSRSRSDSIPAPLRRLDLCRLRPGPRGPAPRPVERARVDGRAAGPRGGAVVAARGEEGAEGRRTGSVRGLGGQEGERLRGRGAGVVDFFWSCLEGGPEQGSSARPRRKREKGKEIERRNFFLGLCKKTPNNFVAKFNPVVFLFFTFENAPLIASTDRPLRLCRLSLSLSLCLRSRALLTHFPLNE